MDFRVRPEFVASWMRRGEGGLNPLHRGEDELSPEADDR
jgi:hypothetical protein